MTLATVAIPSPLMRTTLPGVARAMPRHAGPAGDGIDDRARGAAAERGDGRATGACAGAAPPVPAGAWASAGAGEQAGEHERGDGDPPQGSGQA